ncbi:MAG: class I SAM-dependent methyltransferase [Bacteroidota bacterium]
MSKLLEVYYFFKASPIPKVHYEEYIFGDDFFINKEEQKKGNVTELESRVIAHLVRHFKPTTIFEIGTFNGYSTLNMAMNTPPDTLIYTLDLPQEMLPNTGMKVDANETEYINKSISGAFFIHHEASNKIVQLYGDTYSFDFTPYYKSVDFIFIDASHTYKYVANDTEKALNLLSEKGGVLLWHDYNSVTFKGVTRYLNEKYFGDKRFKDIKVIKGTSLTILTIKG